MGLFNIFRRPRVSVNNLRKQEYITGSPARALATAPASPTPSPQLPDLDPLGEIDSPDPVIDKAQELSEKFFEASTMSEETPQPYVPLRWTPTDVYSKILDADLGVEDAVTIQLNTLYARDHEAWMTGIENDLQSLHASGQTDTPNFTQAVEFRNRQLSRRRESLSIAALGLEANLELRSLAAPLRSKIEIISETVGDL